MIMWNKNTFNKAHSLIFCVYIYILQFNAHVWIILNLNDCYFTNFDVQWRH